MKEIKYLSARKKRGEDFAFHEMKGNEICNAIRVRRKEGFYRRSKIKIKLFAFNGGLKATLIKAVLQLATFLFLSNIIYNNFV